MAKKGLTEEEKAAKAAEKAANADDGIIVEDPELLRPKELPLVIKPASGAWENEAQEQFAGILNGYAYRNPAKWAIKKEVLLSQLKQLGKNPELLQKFMGTNQDRGKVTFKDKRFQGE